MHKEGEVYVIVIKQWRPAFGTYCLELPAGEFSNPLVCLLTMNVFFFYLGVVNEDESTEAAALREVEEETGYKGRVTQVSDTVGVAGISNEKAKLVVIKVSSLFSLLLLLIAVVLILLFFSLPSLF